ncbi:DUF4157 domain-containing protein [Nocardia sp. NPDC057663]|uniref:eCIS core domain-containing protein n=1 Tax=Nocardia sp. NPDC057663 TaxID=3346201 RepID=UPI0036719E3E
MSDEFDTWGLRLDRLARRILAAHGREPSWAPALRTLLEHVDQLSVSADGRFERVESDTGTVDFTAAARPRPETDDEPPPGRAIPDDVRARYERVTGLDAPPVRVHDGPHADTVARNHHADAVTVGQDVYFRKDRYVPQTSDGFGLLAHELTHAAAAARPMPPAHRDGESSRTVEEFIADEVERIAVRDSAPAPAAPAHRLPAMPVRTVPGTARAVPLPTEPAPTPAPSAAVPSPAPAMAASVERDTTAAPANPPDLDSLRRSLFHELKRQLRSDFERGA